VELKSWTRWRGKLARAVKYFCEVLTLLWRLFQALSAEGFGGVPAQTWRVGSQCTALLGIPGKLCRLHRCV
jgi:hypothetical protein